MDAPLTNAIPQIETLARQTLDRYRLQLELYALCLESLFPGRPEYRAVLYLVDRDQTEVLHLDSQALATVRERANDLLAQLVRARPRP